ncbi:MAG TPA: hypothetical protein VLM85_33630 [Polyangiaceae bacterium]|nr:hypothetical protein [Polyangiaceae bacterium]
MWLDALEPLPLPARVEFWERAFAAHLRGDAEAEKVWQERDRRARVDRRLLTRVCKPSTRARVMLGAVPSRRLLSVLSVALLAAFAACSRTPTAPAAPVTAAKPPASVDAGATPTDPCWELNAPLAALPNAITPPEYPFIIAPPAEAAQRQQAVCPRVGPPCARAAMDDRGLLQRVEIEVPITDKSRSRAATEARALEMVRALRVEFGLSVVPKTWTRTKDGGMRFAVDPADGFGSVRFTLETRPEMADDWHGTIELAGITGLNLGSAKPIPKEQIIERFIGRRYCVVVPTGEYETRTYPRVCDPPPGGTPEHCEERVRVGITRRELRTVTREPPTNLRVSLQLTRMVNEGPNKARLVWALWRAEEPTNWESTLLVDAFTGATFTPYVMADTRRLASSDE